MSRMSVEAWGDQSFELWQFERGRVPHDALMGGLLFMSFADLFFLGSVAMMTPEMDIALVVCCMTALVLRHLASVASDKELAYRIAAPLVGLLGLLVNITFALLDSATVDRDAPFETHAALMDIGVVRHTLSTPVDPWEAHLLSHRSYTSPILHLLRRLH